MKKSHTRDGETVGTGGGTGREDQSDRKRGVVAREREMKGNTS